MVRVWALVAHDLFQCDDGDDARLRRHHSSSRRRTSRCRHRGCAWDCDRRSVHQRGRSGASPSWRRPTLATRSRSTRRRGRQRLRLGDHFSSRTFITSRTRLERSNQCARFTPRRANALQPACNSGTTSITCVAGDDEVANRTHSHVADPLSRRISLLANARTGSALPTPSRHLPSDRFTSVRAFPEAFTKALSRADEQAW